MGTKPNTSKKTLDGGAPQAASSPAKTKGASKTKASPGAGSGGTKAAPKTRTAAAPGTARQGAEKPAAKRAASSSRNAASPRSKTGPAPRGKAPALTPEAISLRAYFLSEKRRKLGLPGDPAHDWIEAERELMAEAAPKTKGSAQA